MLYDTHFAFETRQSWSSLQTAEKRAQRSFINEEERSLPYTLGKRVVSVGAAHFGLNHTYGTPITAKDHFERGLVLHVACTVPSRVVR